MQLKKKFRGIVLLKEWVKLGNGKMFGGIFGFVTVMEAKDAAGFTPADKESNWVAVVTQNEVPGEDEPTLIFLGCQIRGFQTWTYSHTLDKDMFQVGSES